MLQKYAFSVSSCKDFELLESADSLSWAKIKAVFSHWNSNDKWWRNLQRNWSFSHVEILNASWFNSYYYCHMILVLLQSLGIASNYFNSSRLRGNCFGSSEVEKKIWIKSFLLYCHSDVAKVRFRRCCCKLITCCISLRHCK